MYIKLTQIDNTPVWLNSAYISAVQPRKNGTGSIVVPAADDIDYDVLEAPETILGMLGEKTADTAIPDKPARRTVRRRGRISPNTCAEDMIAKGQCH